MKKIILYLHVITCLSVAGQSIDSNKVVLKENYEFIVEVKPKVKYNIDSLKTLEVSRQIKHNSGLKVQVLKLDSNFVEFKYWKFKDDSLNAHYNYGKVYVMPKDDFIAYTKQVFSRYKGATIGAYTLPFRLRGIGTENFEFESSLSLSANIVFGFGRRYKNRSLVDISAGIGLTGVKLNEFNSNVTEVRTANAFTLSLGAVWSPHKNVNIGLFGGIDNLSVEDRNVNWNFDRKLWLGLGIGIKFDELTNSKFLKDKEQ